MNLNDVRIFVQVADHGGFAAAGRALGIAKSTLSKRVAALEDQMGVRLIQRGGGRFAITELGRDFHRHAEAMLVEAEAAENVVRGRLAEPSGVVRITASVPTAQLSLAPILPGFARLYPKVRLVVNATDRFLDMVQEGFDIAVRTHFGSLPDSDLVQRRVASGRFILVAAPSYVASHGMPAEPLDLELHQGLIASLGGQGWTLRNLAGEPCMVTPQPRFVADETTLLLAAARDGLGITLLPERFCLPALTEGTLLRILPDWTGGVLTTTILVPTRRGQLPAVRAAVDYLADHLARLET